MAYEYVPFRYKSNEIRLLTLFPSANPTAVVRCELKVASLAENPFYLALSYCWADPPDPRTIKLHGHNTQVTGNLYAALLSLRHKTDVTTWWIDALCINQDDIEERSLQVQRMTSIYSTAHFVVAWIGSQTPGQTSLHQYIRSTEESLDSEPPEHPLISHFQDLLSRKYWRRMWIVQEISMAADIWVVCGSSWVPWATLCKVLKQYEKLEQETTFDGRNIVSNFRLDSGRRWHPSIFPKERIKSNLGNSVALQPTATWSKRDLEESYHGLQTFRDFRALIANRTPINFFNALQKTSAFLATDDRDRFYAILGLVYDSLSFISIPDYKINFDDLQVQMARNILQITRNIEIVIARGPRPLLNENMPSWTPDWLNLGLEAGYAFSGNSDRKFRAAGNSTFIPPTQQPNLHCISAEGLIFERIDGLSTVYGELNLIHGAQTSLLQSSINESPVPHTGAEWLRLFRNSRKSKVRSATIEDLYNCFKGGPDLDPSSQDHINRMPGDCITSGAMWLYYGVNTTSKHDWWFKRCVARYQAKRQFDSPELSMWLRDNRDLLIRGQSVQSLCMADGNGRLLAAIWCNLTVFTPLVYILIILSTGGFISQAMVPADKRIWVIIGSGITTLCGLLMLIGSLIFRWRQIKATQILQHSLLEKMDKYMKQRRLRLATTGGGVGDATGWGGLPAMVPGSAQRGDCIAILKGCTIPVLLREHGDGYHVVGPVYLEKAMNGELMKWQHASWKVCKLY